MSRRGGKLPNNDSLPSWSYVVEQAATPRVTDE